ncbi:MAG: hypothetical protein ACREV9_02285 [Burkholderiales bacterium]
MSFRSAPCAAKKLLSVVDEPWSLEGRTMAVTASIGLFPDHAEDASARFNAPMPPCIEPRKRARTLSQSREQHE